MTKPASRFIPMKKAVPQSEVPGEKTSPRNPSRFSAAAAQDTVSRDNLSTPVAALECRCKAIWDEYGLKGGGPFLPPSKNGAWTVMNTGGSEASTGRSVDRSGSRLCHHQCRQHATMVQ